MSLNFEVRGSWPLKALPAQPEPWMALGRLYVVVLRRRSAQSLPEAEVRDPQTDAVLAVYSWQTARDLFGMETS
jgi:hypothetical protein